MENKTQPCQEAQALLLFPLSRALVANNKSRFFLKSCKRNKTKKAYVDVGNDLLSELPNEIALEILSRLPMKEVARLSLVSQKWRKVWRCYPILNFEDSRPTKIVGKKARHAFIGRVNRILDQYLGDSIDEFKVIFDLDRQFASDIDKWVAFACAKQVKRLELDFTDTNSSSTYKKYTWPIQYQMAHNYHTWRHALTSLSLKFVNITAETVECFLNSFPSLEILCISETNVLTSIRACSSLSLKHLEVTLCFGLNTIVLDAPKLLSFRYEGSTIKLHLNNVSSLSVVSLGTLARGNPIAYAFDPCLNYYAQLEYLELKMEMCDKLNLQIDHCPVLTNLKHLTLFFFTIHDLSLLGWTSLINASPVLQKLTIKLLISSFSRSYNIRREIQKCDGQPLKCLKTLEFVGFKGHCVDLELAMYVLENAVMLEEVVIDTRSPLPLKVLKPNLMAQKRAMKLSSKLPQGAKLIFK